jgi:hypothetical protein
LNEKIKRRTHVVRIFRNGESYPRLVGRGQSRPTRTGPSARETDGLNPSSSPPHASPLLLRVGNFRAYRRRAIVDIKRIIPEQRFLQYMLRARHCPRRRLLQQPEIGYHSMKIIVGTLIAFLLGSIVASNDAEARCWWNGYNHCGYHHQVYHHHGYYHHAWNHDYNRRGYWYR